MPVLYTEIRKFRNCRAGNCDLAQCCLIFKISAALAEMKVASPSSGTQGQRGAIICFRFCWSAGTDEQLSITTLLV